MSRIALVSPTRSSQIESILLRMLQGGQLRGRVSEQQLIDLLEQVRMYPFRNYVSALIINIGRRSTEKGFRSGYYRGMSYSDSSVQAADPRRSVPTASGLG